MKIVFLDIDGVIEPYNSENRFYSDKKIIKKLSELYDVDYSKYNFFDVTAAYYDWDSQAIARLKYILDKSDAKIIISSDWRSVRQPNKMLDLLKIQKLDNYYFKDNIVIDKTIDLAYTRYLEICDSLNRYDISNYVVLDDMKKLAKYFPNNSVITNDLISINDMNEAIKILTKK